MLSDASQAVMAGKAATHFESRVTWFEVKLIMNDNQFAWIGETKSFDE
jgi:hypothetical protein